MRIGKFQVVQQLGVGAHSTILQIRRQDDGRYYALKVVRIDDSEDQKFLDQAEHEFRVAQLLDHPCIVKIHALEIEKDWLFRARKAQMLIEYVNGKTLDLIPGLPVPVLTQIFERVAAALTHMHRRNVCHGDLKPNNILLSRSGEVKVIDFGLAALKGEAKNRIQGTPEYMAPEQVRHKTINEKTDLYNLGATMYRLLTQRLPPSVLGDAAGLAMDSQTWRKLQTPVQELNPDAPPALCALVHGCLSFNPARRPERMADAHAQLETAVASALEGGADRLEDFVWQ